MGWLTASVRGAQSHRLAGAAVRMCGPLPRRTVPGAWLLARPSLHADPRGARQCPASWTTVPWTTASSTSLSSSRSPWAPALLESSRLLWSHSGVFEVPRNRLGLGPVLGALPTAAPSLSAAQVS